MHCRQRCHHEGGRTMVLSPHRCGIADIVAYVRKDTEGVVAYALDAVGDDKRRIVLHIALFVSIGLYGVALHQCLQCLSR